MPTRLSSPYVLIVRVVAFKLLLEIIHVSFVLQVHTLARPRPNTAVLNVSLDVGRILLEQLHASPVTQADLNQREVNQSVINVFLEPCLP